MKLKTWRTRLAMKVRSRIEFRRFGQCSGTWLALAIFLPGWLDYSHEYRLFGFYCFGYGFQIIDKKRSRMKEVGKLKRSLK